MTKVNRAARFGGIEAIIGARDRTDPLTEMMASAFRKVEALRRISTLEELDGDAAARQDAVQLACLFGALTGSEEFGWAAAKNPQAPATVLLWLARRGSEEVRIAVATNARTPAEAFRVLVDDAVALPAVAQNPCAPVDVLERLANHWDPEVRRKVAANPSAPPALRRTILGPPLPTEIFLP